MAKPTQAKNHNKWPSPIGPKPPPVAKVSRPRTTVHGQVNSTVLQDSSAFQSKTKTYQQVEKKHMHMQKPGEVRPQVRRSSSNMVPQPGTQYQDLQDEDGIWVT